MASITKTKYKGLSLPKHYDPSVSELMKNMELIDEILQKAVPNELTSVSEGESNINTLVNTGRYIVKSNATGCPISSRSGVVDVIKAGTNVLQEWRCISASAYVFRRVSTNSGSSWGSWIKMWNTDNDGSGSGLDADKLDGLDSTEFFRVRGTTTKGFNELTTEGKWIVDSYVNAPCPDCRSWACIVYLLGSNQLFQVAYEVEHCMSTDASGGSLNNNNVKRSLMYVRKRTSNGSWSSWQVLWNSSNDGADSGLDADKLDGRHFNELPYVPSTISTSGSYNIDDFLTEGFYSFQTVTSAKTLPTWSTDGSGYGLIVKDARGSGGRSCCHQLLFRDGNSEIYIRHYHTTVWSDWVQVGGTANDILTKLKTVDGSNSGLDADLLDGAEGSDYLKIANLMTELKKVDGSGTGLDADLLDGKHASSFLLISNLLAELRKVDGANSGLDADLLDGSEGSDYLKIVNLLAELKKVDGSGSGLDADAVDNQHEYQFAKYGTASGTLLTTADPTATSTGGCQMYYFQDSSNLIGEGTTVQYGIIQIYYNSSYFIRIAVSMSSGKVYRQTSQQLAWNEITSKLEVLTSDPDNPSEGQIWVVTN